MSLPYYSSDQNDRDDENDDDQETVESMPLIELNYKVFMKWDKSPIYWHEFYNDFIMEAQIRYSVIMI